MSDFGKDIRGKWKDAETADHDNRAEQLIDHKFAAGEQWNQTVREWREEVRPGNPFPLPCLTINTLPQYIGQVIGDRRANATSIKVLPRENGDVKVANVRSELIRSIELQSRADRVYQSTFEQLVTGGLGNFRIDLDYAYDDAFERDLFIRAIPNPMSVLWDPFATDPTGRDAGWCFVSDKISRDEYKRRFKDKAETQLDAPGLSEGGWVEAETIRIAEFWQIIEKPRTIALMQDGSIQDVTDKKEAAWKDQVFVGTDGKPRIRNSPRKFASMILTNGEDQLSDLFELPLCRLPIIRATGREVWIGDKRVRFGLVRFSRDPQLLKNYWRSVVAELLMSAPRANFMAQASAVEGRIGDWPNTLVYNDNTEAPIASTQANLAAILNEAQMCAQDMKDTTGLHDASLGIQSNETSGIAIQRRQHEGDIATIIYHDNMNSSMMEAGEILNDLIPLVYDTARTIRVVGADEAAKMVKINDPSDPEAIDLAVGRYDVTISTGPTYMTRRQEASSSMIEMARVAPQLLEVAGDLIAKAQDWPDADLIAERIKRTIPPQLLGPDEQNDQDVDPVEEQQKAMQQQQAQEMQQQQQEMAIESAQLDLRIKSAQADEAEAKARRAEAEAGRTNAEVTDIKANQALKGAAMAEAATTEPADPTLTPEQLTALESQQLDLRIKAAQANKMDQEAAAGGIGQ